MFQPDKKCSFCKMPESVCIVENAVWDFPGTTDTPPFIVSGITTYKCTACGEEFVSPEMDKLNHPKMVEARRRALGQLGSEELKQLVQQAPMSERELEKVLGFGAKTLTNIKNAKRLHSQTTDNYLFLIKNHPELLDELVARHNITIQNRKRGRPKKGSA